MNDSSSQPRRLALVIDADNAQPSLIQPVLLAAASRGRVTVRRIYGDWTSPNMTSWKAHLLDHSIRPIQQFRIVGGKNATDSAMIIDAMDLLHSGLVDGFCIVSSDSDFTSLARRIQESGLFVMGVGRRTTPVAFQRACEEFVFTDDMRASPPVSAQKKKPAASSGSAAARPEQTPRRPRNAQPDAQILELLSQGIRSATDEDSGWAGIGRVGQIVRQYEPGFSHKDYGHASLSGLLESHPELFRLRKGDNGQAQVQLIERAADKQLELLPEPATDSAPETAGEAPAKSRRSRPQRKAKPTAETVTPAPAETPAAAVQAAVESTEVKPAKPRAPRRSRTRKAEGEAPQS
ncbi:MAG: NYN domain-containing protein [Methyloversatilis discipulorum]|uniref:NYN domain-containing protein n=1 Tax=Methyloversatilis discipulorum TaxID=1119528 RepID=UPI0026F3353C|nr:NYN domain-containing protein [Methyloversatilis discipulorum]MBV5286120.1 NYN domain-containing protein [Methyloversatilis discipulorum]